MQAFLALVLNAPRHLLLLAKGLKKS
ncbi:MAG: hypothetical protein JWO89_2881, partial [Verrucomicrobiaceae bacterium]|nr:hypothetical protein [Verrucomicrobiaceae bacterium]